MPLRTAFLVPYPYLPATSGGRVAAAGFARALAGAGGLAAVISAVGNELPEEGLPYPLHEVLPAASSRYLDLAARRRVLELIDELGIEYLIVQQPFMVPLLLRGLRRRGVKTWVWSHNLEYRRFRTLGKWFWPVVKAVEGYVYRRADRVLFISKDELPEAVREFGLSPDRCGVLPFGTDLAASPVNRAAVRERGLATWSLPDRPTLLFFGSLGYEPNLVALDQLLGTILPALEERLGRGKFQLLIAGGGLPAAYGKLAEYRQRGVHYLGFVADLGLLLPTADVMLNPVDTGAGIKTKVIDALAGGLTVVSSRSGALGIDQFVCEDKLVVVPDGDSAAFVDAVVLVLQRPYGETPGAFYGSYSWRAAADSILSYP